MPRFFVPDIEGETVMITGEDAGHIARSLRMRVGEELTVCDLAGWDYRCVLESVTPGLVTAGVVEKAPCKTEPRIQVRLFQALPKSDKLEWIVQKATELGAVEIIPVLSERCISRPDHKSMEKKRQRLEAIALEAAKQAGRGMIPRIGSLLRYSEALEEMKRSDLALLFYERAKEPLNRLLDRPFVSVSILTGSEGGFSAQEAEEAFQRGIPAVSLGSRILRCETAPVSALSAIMYAANEFEIPTDFDNEQ